MVLLILAFSNLENAPNSVYPVRIEDRGVTKLVIRQFIVALHQTHRSLLTRSLLGHIQYCNVSKSTL